MLAYQSDALCFHPHPANVKSEFQDVEGGARMHTRAINPFRLLESASDCRHSCSLSLPRRALLRPMLRRALN